MMITRDWQRNRDMWVRVLEKQTGQGVDAWNRRLRKETFADERRLRSWLTRQGVTGYAQQLLVMERFGYPDFVTANADQLIGAQYADRPQLRPIYDAILKAVTSFGDVILQARKGYVSLVTPRRTFARIIPTTKTRIDLGLRIAGLSPGGRLQRSRIHETMRVQVGLTSPKDVDAEVKAWLRRAYAENTF